MSFENYRTNPKNPLEEEKKRRKLAQESQNLNPPQELFRLEKLREEGEIERAGNFDEIFDGKMGVRFAGDQKVYYSEKELEEDENLREDFRMNEPLEEEIELSDRKKELVDKTKFEKGSGWKVNELQETLDEERGWDLGEIGEIDEPSNLEISFEEN